VMGFRVTCRVDSHERNFKYRCLVVDLLCLREFHYRVRNGRLVMADLMLRDE